nr:AAA family ATPase [Pseudenhygromyxa sp. WMMC2535]
MAIRGKNLASLAGHFEVDFCEPPLDRAGLIAITGPTGAGKSTLLDAMCLALFDRTPRFANRGGVVIGGAGDDGGLRATDVRGILRHGAADAWAEVDFLGVDDHRWRARWEVRRARNRVEGRIQAQQMRLSQLDPGLGSERPVEAGRKSDVLAEIEARLGLDFDQFRRSVLLAQGEFAAFLEASGNERAELLERMTGTGLYRELGRAAFERAKIAEQERTLLERERERLTLLDARERGRLDSLARNLGARVNGLDARRRRLDAQLRWRGRLRELEQAHGAAKRELAAWDARVEELRELAEELGWMERLAPLRRQLRERDGLRQTLDEREEELRFHRGEQEIYAEQRKQQGKAFEAAEELLSRTQERRRRVAPELERARELDARLGELSAARSRAAEKLDALRPQIAQSAKALAEIQDAQVQVRAKREACERWMREHRELRELADQWGHYSLLLQHQQRDLAQCRALRREIAEEKGPQLERLAVELRGAKAKLEAAVTQRDLARGRLRAVEKALAEAPGIVELRARSRRQAEQQARARDLGRIQDALADNRRRAELLEQEKVALVAKQDRQLVRKGALEREFARAEAAYAEARRALRHLEAVRDLAEHRRELQPGEPCPLCGAEEHPLVDGGEQAGGGPEDDRLSAQQAQTEALLRARDGHQRELGELASGIAATRASLEQLSAQERALEQGRAELGARWRELSAAFEAEEQREAGRAGLEAPAEAPSAAAAGGAAQAGQAAGGEAEVGEAEVEEAGSEAARDEGSRAEAPEDEAPEDEAPEDADEPEQMGQLSLLSYLAAPEPPRRGGSKGSRSKSRGSAGRAAESGGRDSELHTQGSAGDPRGSSMYTTSGLPVDVEDPRAPAALDACVAVIEARGEAIERDQSRVDALSEDRTARQLEVDGCEARLEGCRQALEQLTRAREPLERAIDRDRAEIERLEREIGERLSELDNTITPILRRIEGGDGPDAADPGAGEGADSRDRLGARLSEAPKPLISTLNTARMGWEARVSARDDARDELVNLENRQVALVSVLASRRETEDSLVSELEAIDAKIAGIQEARRGLFEGRPAAEVERELEGEVALARGERERCKDAVAKLDVDLRGRRAQIHALENQLEELRGRFEAAAKETEVALAGAALEQARLDTLLSDEARWAEERLRDERERVEAARAGRARALTVVEERERVLGEHRAGRPEGDAAPEDTRGGGEDTRGGGENTRGGGEDTRGGGEDTRGGGENTRGTGEAEDSPEAVAEALAALEAESTILRSQLVEVEIELRRDAEARARAEAMAPKLAAAQREAEIWGRLRDTIGSASGDKFQRFAQSLTLELLLAQANAQLRELKPRYALARVPMHDLELQLIDHDLGDEVRSIRGLSGGEKFLVSLALALALASLSAEDCRIDSLFIDEGFGSLDAHSLDVAVSTLDALQAEGRQIGVISHVPGLAERVGVEIRVEPQSSGRSSISVVGVGNTA